MKYRDSLVFLVAIFVIVYIAGALSDAAQTAFYAFLCALWLSAVVDAARRPEESWRANGRSKTMTLVVLALCGMAASVSYFAVIRPDLRDRGHPGEV